jgi:hypothetical protein
MVNIETKNIDLSNKSPKSSELIKITSPKKTPKTENKKVASDSH